MAVEVRYARPDEFPAVTDLDAASFGLTYSAEQLADIPLEIDVDRLLGAFDGQRLAGVSAELPFRLTLPGGADVAAVGLTWVSIELTYRRRGILRSLIEHQLRTSAAEGAAATILGASEGGIYGRYGFGVAAHVRAARVTRRRARLRVAVDASSVRQMTTEHAREMLPAIHERWRRQTPGGLRRDDRRWAFVLLDREYQRNGASGLFHLVHPDGYVSYRIKPDWGTGDPQHQCVIVDYAPVTEAAHAALWQVLLSMDLVGTIESYRIPLDDPLPLLLADPRGVDTTHLGDGMWLRPVEVEQLLGRRTYALEVDCVVGVRDHVLGDGRYLVRGGPDGATCVRTDRLPDVTVDVADLGGVALGGTRLLRMARTGRVDCTDAILLARLDRALSSDREPAPGTAF